MRSRAFVIVALAIAPAVSAAQSPITRPKQQAQRAVNQTNAHTRAMTDTSAGSTATSRSSTTAPKTALAAPGPRIAGSATSPNADTTRARTSKGTTAKPERVGFEREIFAYERAGRRDPFISLMTTSDIRPLLPDLRLVGIAFDKTGRNSVAVLREDAQEQTVAPGGTKGAKSNKDVPQYRVKEGQQLGRMRVARIGQRSVTFTIEEFGYSRQETLTLSESNTEKKP